MLSSCSPSITTNLLILGMVSRGVSGFLIWGLVWAHLYPKYYFNHSLYFISILFLWYALRKDSAKDRNALSLKNIFFAVYMEGSVLLGLACEIHGTTCMKYLRLRRHEQFLKEKKKEKKKVNFHSRVSFV